VSGSTRAPLESSVMRAAIAAARRRRGAGRVGAGEGAALASTRGVEGTACHGVRGDAVTRLLARASTMDGVRKRARTLAVTYASNDLLTQLPACSQLGVQTICVGVGPISRRVVAAFGRAGIQLRTGVQRVRADELHRDVCFASVHLRPWVTLKAAVSLDGMMACANGKSRWITGSASRREGHRLRGTHDAIAVGAETVRIDNPKLTVREVRGEDPRVVVFDSQLKLVGGKRKFHALRPGTIVVHGAQARETARVRAVDAGLVPIGVRTGPSGRLDVRDALRRLADLSVRSLMVEGGGALLASFYAAELWEEIYLFCAPKLLGGASRSLLPGLSWVAVERAPALRVVNRRSLGEDTLTVLAPRLSRDR